MNNPDYFFLIFLLTIAVSRFVLAFPKRAKLSIGSFRIHHYMYAIVLIPLSFFIHNLTIFAFGVGFLADELPLIPVRGLGYRNEHWHGCDDYFTSWCVAGVFVIVCVVYILRGPIAALI